MTEEMTLQELYAKIFAKPEPKFVEGEVAYTTNAVYPNHFFKVVVLNDSDGMVTFRTQHVLDSAIAPHYSVGKRGDGKLVKADEVPSDGIKLEWLK